MQPWKKAVAKVLNNSEPHQSAAPQHKTNLCRGMITNPLTIRGLKYGCGIICEPWNLKMSVIWMEMFKLEQKIRNVHLYSFLFTHWNVFFI